MKKSQIKVFEELLADPSFNGKKQLKHLLWLNTAPQKAKVGDCFVVSDPGHRIYGHPIKNFNAKVVGVSAFITDEDWYYKLEMVVIYGGKETVTAVHLFERDLMKCPKATNNTNLVGDPKDEHPDSMDVRF